MARALAQAEIALFAGEVPVGCVDVRNNIVVAEAHNTTNRDRDPLSHAEINVLEQLGGDTEGVDFYITLEPCAMCAGILERAGIPVYFGSHNEVFGGRKLLGRAYGHFLDDSRAVDILQRFYSLGNTVEKRNVL